MTKHIVFIQGARDKQHPDGSGKLIMYLQEHLGNDYAVLAPDMPDPDNPRYLDWKAHVAHELATLPDETILIGHSLGGSVVVKALVEGMAHPRIVGLFLVAVPYWGGDAQWPVNEFVLPEDFATKLPRISPIILYHSRNDAIVPASHLWCYHDHLPQAMVRILESGGHAFVTGLPELVDDLRSL